MAKRALINEPLSVDPSLIGATLASPARRAVAFAVDLLLLSVPTVAMAILAAALALNSSDPRALRAIRTLVSHRLDDTTTRRAAVCDLVPLLVRTEARGLPAPVVAAVEEGNVTLACERLRGYDITFVLNFGETEQKPESRSVRLPIQNVIPPGTRVLALFGVPALYFVALTRSRRGATIGKRLAGIRVARLDSKRLSWLESLERFVGYVHIPGTMFLGLIDFWRDPNRRLAHDRAVHTAVFRQRRHQPFPPVAAGGVRKVAEPAAVADSGAN